MIGTLPHTWLGRSGEPLASAWQASADYSYLTIRTSCRPPDRVSAMLSVALNSCRREQLLKAPTSSGHPIKGFSRKSWGVSIQSVTVLTTGPLRTGGVVARICARAGGSSATGGAFGASARTIGRSVSTSEKTAGTCWATSHDPHVQSPTRTIPVTARRRQRQRLGAGIQITGSLGRVMPVGLILPISLPLRDRLCVNDVGVTRTRRSA
jgi:hypothetical protein